MKLENMLKASGLNYNPVALASGAAAYFVDNSGRDFPGELFKKCYCEYRANYNTVLVMDQANKAINDSFDYFKKEMHAIFWAVLAAEKERTDYQQAQELAKGQQYKYAVENNCINVFNAIYS